jgi:hypothetical protein
VTVAAYVIAVLSLVVVLGTRLQLRGAPSGWLLVHTVVGVVGFVLWIVFLAMPETSFFGGSLFGVIALGCWWVVSVVGLVLLAGLRSGGGRRVASTRRGTGAALAAVVHLAVLAAWVLCTWAYATKKI